MLQKTFFLKGNDLLYDRTKRIKEPNKVEKISFLPLLSGYFNGIHLIILLRQKLGVRHRENGVS